MIPELLLFALTAAVAVRAFRRRAEAFPSHSRQMAVIASAFAVALLAAWAALRSPAGVPATLLSVLGVVACLALWDSLVALSLRGVGPRGWWPNMAMGALALWMGVSGGGLILAVLLGRLALSRWGSRKGARGREERWVIPAAPWAIPGAIALIALQVAMWFDASLRSPSGPLLHYVQWCCGVTALQAARGLPELVRQSALAIRRVGRRLTLLFLLSAFVPLALTGALWALTTWLGVGSEHALIAARALNEDALAFERAIRSASATGPDADATLARVMAERWPNGDVWTADGAASAADTLGGVAWRHPYGRLARIPGALERWKGGDSVRVAVIDNVAYLVATRAGSEHGARAFALLPADSLIERRLARIVDARLGIETSLTGRAGSDTLDLRGLSDGRPRITVKTPTSSGPGIETARPTSGLFNGRATVPALVWRGNGWRMRMAVVVARNDVLHIVTGLFRDVRENPFVVFPIFVIFVVLLVFVFVLLYDFSMVRDLGNSISGAVGALRAGTTALEGGDLTHRIEVRGTDDLWDVAGAFNRMAAGLERGRELEAERRRVEGEMTLARRIQARLLPGLPPTVPGLEIAGSSQSARHVGGDYYDHFALPDGRVALVVADVSGKGVPAALLMSGVRAALVSQPVEREDPAEVFTRINRFLHRSIEAGQFVTAFLAFIDPATGRLVYCNAGHNPPIVIAPDGAVTRLEAGGLVLGMLEDATYDAAEITLAPGALVALFTDGVTEAQAPGGALWDEPPLIALLAEARGVPLGVLAARIVESVRAFEAGQPASDDVTLLLARRVDPRG